MTAIIITTVGERKGTPRIWFEGAKLEREGYRQGTHYQVDESKPDRLTLIRVDDPMESRIVSGRKRGSKQVPIIDLNSQLLAKWFSISDKLRIAIRRGKIVITRHHLVGQIKERFERIRKKIAENRKLAVHSHYHGAGVLDLAIHSGLAKSGAGSYVQVAIELDRKYQDISLTRNPELFSEDSILIEGPIQDVRCDPRVKADILLAGIPCTGASVAGRAKMRDTKGEKRTYLAEEHDQAGALFYYTLRYIESAQPALIVLENVKAYGSTASMAIIRAVLSNLGYRVEERVLGGNEFGALENRERLCVVAVTEGLEDIIDMNAIVPIHKKPEKLGDVLEDVPEDSEMWSEMAYLAEKEKRDIAQGKGFRRQLFTGEEDKISTVTRQYIKRRSTDPFIQHPTKPELSRLLTKYEHAAVKGIPAKLIDDDDISSSVAHEALGQSIVFPMFEAVGYAIGTQLRKAFSAQMGLLSVA
jgi:DNA (cytosine-5)-methyltransferase 1